MSDLSSEVISQIGRDLDEAQPPARSSRDVDRLVRELASNIRAAQKRGLSYAMIVERITKSGFALTVGELTYAMRKRRPRKRKAPGAKSVAGATPGSAMAKVRRVRPQ